MWDNLAGMGPPLTKKSLAHWLLPPPLPRTLVNGRLSFEGVVWEVVPIVGESGEGAGYTENKNTILVSCLVFKTFFFT